jgi:hypothetical protein
MGKKKTSTKKAAAPAPVESLSRLSAPELPSHLLEELAVHTGQASAIEAEAAVPVPKKASSERSEIPDAEPEDSAADAAVDDIVRQEGDQILADADEATAGPEPQKRRGFWRSIGHFFAAWWRNKIARTITILIILAAIAAAAVIPTSRYFVLNFAGVRSTSSVRVIDTTTRLPLKNVTVSVGSQKALTDSNGVATVKDIRLGKQTVTIKRIAFAPIKQQVTIGWGSNPLGEFLLKATGVQYRITAKDYVSGKPIVGAEATSGEAVARSDDDGIITLTLEEVGTPTIDVSISAAEYRTEPMTITADTEAVNDSILVPSARTVFVSHQSGRYDVVSMYLDGKDRKIELQGTGRENKNIGLVSNTSGSQAAVVSTRDDLRDDDGFLLSTLTVLDLEKGTKQTVSHAEHIQLVDWTTNNLVFVEASAGASAANANRYRIVSYDFNANKRTQLASANQFNNITSIHGTIYYAVSSTDPHATAAFFRIKPDGTNRQTVFSQEAWTVLRTGYESLLLQSPDSWYSYTADGSPQKSIPPTSYQSRRYVDGSNNKSLWIDVRAGQSVLHAYDPQTKKDQEVLGKPGLSYPVRWLNAHTVIYRIATDHEVADYAVSASGGTTRKITDTVSSYGFSN